MIAVVLAGFAVTLAALGLTAYLVRRSGVEREQTRADVAAAMKRAEDAEEARRRAEVRQSEFEGVAKEQAAECLRAKAELAHVSNLFNAERERADTEERLRHAADLKVQTLARQLPGGGLDLLLDPVADMSAGKRYLTLAAGPDRARDRSGGGPDALPDGAAAGSPRLRGEYPTLPGGK